MRAQANTNGTLFEADAADHDINAGDITHPRQLSRDLTSSERVAGRHHPDSQKVWAVCDVCGYRREIDQAPQNPKRVVEAKSSVQAAKKGTQKANNLALARRGIASTYKLPAGLSEKQLEGLTEFNIVLIKP